MKNELNFCFWYKVTLFLSLNSTRTLQNTLWCYEFDVKNEEEEWKKISQLTADLLFNLTEFTLPLCVFLFFWFTLMCCWMVEKSWSEKGSALWSLLFSVYIFFISVNSVFHFFFLLSFTIFFITFHISFAPFLRHFHFSLLTFEWNLGKKILLCNNKTLKEFPKNHSTSEKLNWTTWTTRRRWIKIFSFVFLEENCLRCFHGILSNSWWNLRKISADLDFLDWRHKTYILLFFHLFMIFILKEIFSPYIDADSEME